MEGAQVVGRVAAVLRAVSAAMPSGAGTSAVADETGLARPTVHRILTSLAADGFVDRGETRWFLGPELYLMGAIAAERYDITDIARDSLRALAAATGESAFLSARRGDESVCLLREEGSFPIRSFVLYEGIRFPLGVASAGLAMLAFLPEEQAERYLASVDLVPRWGAAHSADAVRRRVVETRSRGYAVNPGLIVEGSWGMGAAVFDGSGQPAWALSLTGVASRFGPDRVPELGRLLLEHAHRISQRLGG
ncbi:MAG TPA: IclR family transcriptional regulator [Pseudolysinimonas sp.]|nr:IclR family transcriptional regulator [Pseudolysinimonas sp.]